MPAAAFFATLDDASERNILTVHRIMSSPDDRVLTRLRGGSQIASEHVSNRTGLLLSLIHI